MHAVGDKVIGAGRDACAFLHRQRRPLPLLHQHQPLHPAHLQHQLQIRIAPQTRMMMTAAADAELPKAIQQLNHSADKATAKRHQCNPKNATAVACVK